MSSLRRKNLEKLPKNMYDVLIVGGGINGAVSAAALAAKGAKVALIDKGDFAGFTSSNSSNLAWGGIKYLESHEYGLVNKLCKSRNHLMRSYPSTVKEIRFLTSIQKGFRFPPFLVYIGTVLYWIIGRFFTRMPTYLIPRKIKALEKVINTKNVAGGFEYSDSYLYDNDARFVFNFIRSGIDYGGVAVNYVKLEKASWEGGRWTSQVRDEMTGEVINICSKALINATGPFVDEINETNLQKTNHRHVFSKGIHLIIDKITDSQKVLTFFASDGRLFFMIPMGPQTCIGTTDTQVKQPQTYVTKEDRTFVLSNINQLLSLDKPLTEDDVIAERCGVRPLAVQGENSSADWVQLSRKHAIDRDADRRYLSIFGGKLTDCINVGNEVANLIADFGITLPNKNQKWYGEPTDSVRREFYRQAELMNLNERTPASSTEPLTERFWRRYGQRAIDMLASIREDPEKGRLLIENSEYLRVEIEHAAKHEMITKLEDFLRRRSKISLVVRREKILGDPGLYEVCKILFGNQAEARLQEYRTSLSHSTDAYQSSVRTASGNKAVQ